jgi:hypothetical protein
MGHKDSHRATSQPGLSGAGHHSNHPGADHPAPFLGEGELLNGPHPGDTDVNVDALWVDIGGEG